jgi:hypothetical protein
MARCEPWVWRRMWKFTAGEIPARSFASSRGRSGGRCPTPRRRRAGKRFRKDRALGSSPQSTSWLRRSARRGGFDFSLAEPDRQRAAVAVEVAAFQAGQFGVAAAGEQRGSRVAGSAAVRLLRTRLGWVASLLRHRVMQLLQCIATSSGRIPVPVARCKSCEILPRICGKSRCFVRTQNSLNI